MEATSILREEHGAVLRITDAMDSLAGHLADGLEPREDHVSVIGELLGRFVRAHQEKEELLLFPAIMGSDASVVFGVIGTLVSEHGASRLAQAAIFSAMRGQAGEVGSRREGLAGLVSGYAESMRMHVALEENECFDVADSALFPEVKQFLAEGYEDIDCDWFGSSALTVFESALERFDALVERPWTAVTRG